MGIRCFSINELGICYRVEWDYSRWIMEAEVGVSSPPRDEKKRRNVRTERGEGEPRRGEETNANLSHVHRSGFVFRWIIGLRCGGLPGSPLSTHRLQDGVVRATPRTFSRETRQRVRPRFRPIHRLRSFFRARKDIRVRNIPRGGEEESLRVESLRIE